MLEIALESIASRLLSRNLVQVPIVWRHEDVRFAQRLLDVGAPPPLPSPEDGGGEEMWHLFET